MGVLATGGGGSAGVGFLCEGHQVFNIDKLTCDSDTRNHRFQSSSLLATDDLQVTPFGRAVTWLDSGTRRDLFSAYQVVKVIEGRTRLKIACPEKVAWSMKFINQAVFEELIDPQRCLRSLVETASLIPNSDVARSRTAQRMARK